MLADRLLAVDGDAAALRLEQAEDAFQGHRLAVAGATDDHDRFADPDIEVDATQHRLLAERFVKAADGDLRRRGHFEKKASVMR